MSRSVRWLFTGLVIVLPLLAIAAPAVAGQAALRHTSTEPAGDTGYHLVIDLDHRVVQAALGRWPLVTCTFRYASDSGRVRRFDRRWMTGLTVPRRIVSARRLWRGHDAVSDTVVAVVSRIAGADPRQIRRVLPDRFSIDFPGGLRLVVSTPDGIQQGNCFAEVLDRIRSTLVSWGRSQTLALVVSPEDAQTLYYAFEPGTPVLLRVPQPPTVATGLDAEH